MEAKYSDNNHNGLMGAVDLLNNAREARHKENIWIRVQGLKEGVRYHITNMFGTDWELPTGDYTVTKVKYPAGINFGVHFEVEEYPGREWRFCDRYLFEFIGNCDKCMGGPIRHAWRGTKLCEVCFGDLKAEKGGAA